MNRPLTTQHLYPLTNNSHKHLWIKDQQFTSFTTPIQFYIFETICKAKKNITVKTDTHSVKICTIIN